MNHAIYQLRSVWRPSLPPSSHSRPPPTCKAQFRHRLTSPRLLPLPPRRRAVWHRKSSKPGTGKAHPAKSDLVTVHYTGWTTDGKMFDSSKIGGGKPATFPLDRVITGWTEGVQLMVAGETRRFWIPEALAYKGVRDPKGMLVFDVELMSFRARHRRRLTSRLRRPTRRKQPVALPTKCSSPAPARDIPVRPTKSPCTTPAGRPTEKCSTAR